MQPMPFCDDDIRTDQSGVAHQDSERNNLSNMSMEETLPAYFHLQDPDTKDVYYRTPEMEVWKVPVYLQEARATDMF